VRHAVDLVYEAELLRILSFCSSRVLKDGDKSGTKKQIACSQNLSNQLKSGVLKEVLFQLKNTNNL
jgi:hypothetical protein